MSALNPRRVASSPTIAPDELAKITEVRAADPGRIDTLWSSRRRRPLLGADGRLLLVAADHSARGALGVNGDPRAMASRGALLARLVESLSRPGVDGVLGTPDILEDLLLLGALDGTVAIGSMNRGGLQGAVFELDDRFTAYRAKDLASRGIDGGQDAHPDRSRPHGDDRALHVRARRRQGRQPARPGVGHPVDARRRRAGRHECAHTWLKLPVVDDLPGVLEATTLPTVLLGGDPSGDPHDTAVRGLVVGRALLYPPDGDVAAALDFAAAIVHGGRR